MDYNQKIHGCPVDCSLFLGGSAEPLPAQPFTTYGTSGIFSVFTSDVKYDGRTYAIDAVCKSTLSQQEPIVQSFSISFVHDESASDTQAYSECANDFIYWNSDLISFDLPVSANPVEVSYEPFIQ